MCSGGGVETGWADPERSDSNNRRIRSVFSRMAVTLRNIHFGGALSGNAAIRFSQSMFCTLEPRSLPSPLTWIFHGYGGGGLWLTVPKILIMGSVR